MKFDKSKMYLAVCWIKYKILMDRLPSGKLTNEKRKSRKRNKRIASLKKLQIQPKLYILVALEIAKKSQSKRKEV